MFLSLLPRLLRDRVYEESISNLWLQRFRVFLRQRRGDKTLKARFPIEFAPQKWINEQNNILEATSYSVVFSIGC